MSKQQAPPWQSWLDRLIPPFVLFDIVMALLCCIAGLWDRAAFFVAMAVFLTVINR